MSKRWLRWAGGCILVVLLAWAVWRISIGIPGKLRGVEGEITAAAAQFTLDMFPDAGLDLAVQKLQAERQVPLMFSSLTDEFGFGWWTDESVDANRQTLALLGTPVEAVFPFGPLAGAAVNVTLLSYQNELNVGVNIDPAAVPDVDVFMECLRTAYDDLLDLV